MRIFIDEHKLVKLQLNLLLQTFIFSKSFILVRESVELKSNPVTLGTKRVNSPQMKHRYTHSHTQKQFSATSPPPISMILDRGRQENMVETYSNMGRTWETQHGA